jgi:hypothetical protein
VRFRVARVLLAVLVTALGLGGVLAGTGAPAARAADAVDEIHVGYGNLPATSMWVYWRGAVADLSYGTTTAYGRTVAAATSAVTPVDRTGPFHEVQLSGLTPNTQYHYRIGGTGADHAFRTAPSGDFSWVDIGDTGTTYYTPAAPAECNKPWMASHWSQILGENPAFVTHGGDISYANICGKASVSQLFRDISGVASTRPMMFSWGNHEYGLPTAASPAGTPRDSMANYKGRFNPPNPQTTPSDTATQTSHPGCPNATNTGNGCRGEDWGSFRVGRVLFVSEPEQEAGAFPDWQTKAGALMAAAQNDPGIALIVTYGHRPAYTSLASQSVAELKTALDALGDRYSPAARPDGKYVLNIAHHVHGGEIFAPQHGVVQVVNGGGGTEPGGYPSTAPGSQWKTGHFEHLRATVTGASIRLDFMCGPAYPPNPTKDGCTQGSVIHSATVRAGSAGGTTEYVTNPGLETAQTGWTGTYNAVSKVTRSTVAAHHGTWSLRTDSTATVAQPAGVNNVNPVWVTNSVLGKPYTATAWVRASTPGLTARVVLREIAGTTTVGSAQSPAITLSDTAWHQVPATYAARGSGNSIKMSVLSTNLIQGRYLLVDDLSLRAPS